MEMIRKRPAKKSMNAKNAKEAFSDANEKEMPIALHRRLQLRCGGKIYS